MIQESAEKKSRAVDEKFCAECGEVIRAKAEICPYCGVRQPGSEGVNKVALLLLTFFLGGIGAHKFYFGKNWQGFFYLLFCWTGIPGIIALVEFIIYAFTSTESLQKKYTVKGGAGIIIAVVVGGFGMIALIGILAAIAIPNFVAYRNRAYEHSLDSAVQNLIAAEESYFSVHAAYSSDIQEMNLTLASPDISVEILAADTACYKAKVTHNQLPESVSVDCNTR